MPEPTDPLLSRPEKSPESVLSEMIGAYRISQVVFAAARLGIADLLRDQAMNSEELAQAAGADPHALHRLLVVLASVGIVREVAATRFALTPMGALLQKGQHFRDSAIMTAELFWPAYGELLHAVRTGLSGFERAFGMPIYDYLAEHPEADAAYAARMTAATSTIAAALTTSYDFSGLRTVVDVGGGRGALLGAILRAHSHLQGILFDRPSVVAGARDALEALRVGERCETVAGSFFDGLPGGDVYVLKWVISEWDDDRAAVILKNCRHGMAAGGRVLVVDPLDLPSNALFNLAMLVTWNGGRVRSPADLRTLFATAGLRVERIISTDSQFSIIEGRPT